MTPTGFMSWLRDMAFEAHSTDYQSTEAVADLIKARFFFLKAGPELTYRFYEAV